jgi:hypothetical protein
MGNPFFHRAFKNWINQIPLGSKFLEPFAGNGQICKLLADAGILAEWTKFDIDTSLKGVCHRDTLRDFPAGFSVVLTNPPYLSYHFAKRKRLPIEKDYFSGFPSLYLKAINLSLFNSDYVGMIIPESFLTSGYFRSRLMSVISLPYQMFNDTDMPACLSLWGPDSSNNSFEIWRGAEYLGLYNDLANALQPTPCAARIRFNVVSGSVGLKAIDNTTGPTIQFCDSSEIVEKKIKHSARLVSRIEIDGAIESEKLIRRANEILSEWRTTTKDILLTAFKGYRKDGAFRRRLDFANARSILSHAICLVENHSHQDNFESTLF